MEDNLDIKNSLLNSIAISSCDQIQAICQDFFNKTEIHYYNYVRIFHDGSRISLMNNKEWGRVI